MSVPDYYKYAVLAAASYVRLGAEPLDGATFARLAGSDQQGRLPVSLGTALFNPEDAAASKWNVLHYYGGDKPGVQDTTGFAATLFERNGEKVLGIRGTEPTEDGLWDLVAADIGQIGILGLALTQVVSMVNLIQRMKGADGQLVDQIRINASIVPSLGAITVVGTPPMFLTFNTYQAVGQGLIGPGEKIKVTGHSLGGHLAYIAARLFPDVVDQQVHVFDPAGYDPSAANLVGLFSLLAPVVIGGALVGIKGLLNAEFGAGATGVLPFANQLTEPVLSELAGLLGTTQGSPNVIPLQTEDILPGDDAGVVSSRVTAAERYGAPIIIPSEANSHAMEVFMDALALQATIHSLSPALTLSQAERLLQSSSFKLATTDERLAAAFFKLFVPNEALPGGMRELPPSDATSFISGNLLAGKGELPARQAFYQALLRVQREIDGKGYQLVSLADHDATSLSAQAFANIGYRYAIAELNSFAIVDASGSLYARFQGDGPNVGELDIYDASSGRGRLTSAWIDDRARLAQAELLRNFQDNAEIALLPGDGVTATEFRFYRGDREDILFAEPVSSPAPSKLTGRRSVVQRTMVSFADDGGRSLVGTDNIVGDHLYGGAGNDALSGERGEDHLEGGLGEDRIHGGEGADVLLGGAGADALNGGLGADTYQWRKGDGLDTITDVREGGVKLGTIEFLGESLAGSKQQYSVDNPYLFTDVRGILYALNGSSGVDGILTIVKPDEAGGLRILGFRSGDFGIELGPVQSAAMTDQPGTAASDNSFSAQPGHAESLRSEVENQRVYGFAGNDRIVVSHQGAEAYGGIGRDYITNDAGDQKLYGEEDDDILIASAGNDLLDGGTGHDALQGGTDDDVLVGGDGDDFIDGGLGSDAISGGDGRDFIVGGGSMVVTIGEGALDEEVPPQFGVFVSGGALGFAAMSGQLIATGDGSNAIDAGAGDDVVIGGDATDYVEGGHGDDWLLGFAGQDSLFGDDGNDTIFGDVTQGAYSVGGQLLYTLAALHASDYLDGGAGEDTLSGDGGADELVGGAGNDLLLGDDGRLSVEWHGADYLDGGEGDDQLIGHGEDDILFGGSGNDQLDGDSSDTPFAMHGADYLDGEDGNDLLKGSGGADTLFGGEGEDQLFGDTDDTPIAFQGDDFLDGGEGDDYLRAYGGADMLFGGDGADEMLGEAGDDLLDGEDGNDLISGGDGADELVGGAGDDDLRADAGDDTLDGGDGDDLLAGGLGNDMAHGGGGNDQVAGSEGADVLHGDEGSDSLFGEAGDDTLEGGVGADTLLGGAARDVLFGGDGDDVLAGEDGTLEDFGGDDRLEGGAGADSLLGEGGADTLSGGDGSDDLAGGAGSDALDGGEGDDLLHGEFGDDSLAGGDGADVLHGGAGHDTLEGSAGDDLLYGGAGDDVLAGGAGNDAYLFDDGLNGTDRIVDSTANGDVNTLILPFLYGSGAVRLSLGSLVVGVGPGIRVHIEGFDPDDPWTNVAINRFQFTNRTLTYEELLEENRLFITGTPDEDVLSGTVLDDVLVGMESDDLLLGKAGDDELTGSAGADTLVGAEGDDAYRDVEAEDLLVEQAGEGHDRVETLQRTFTLPENIEDLIVLGVGGTADLTGNELDNTITVNSGIDGGIVVRGMGGNDVIVGTAGSDTLDGGAGSNHLAGRGGDDVYVVTAADQTFIFELAGEGHDVVLAHASVGLPLDSEVEDVFLVDGSSAISVVGNGLANHIVGNDLANILYGELPGNASAGGVPTTPLPPGTVYDFLGAVNDAQGDLIEAGAGDDFLDGGARSDTLLGGEGNDELVGEVGADVLVGGDGNDTLDGSRVLTVRSGEGIVLVGDDESTDTMDGGAGDDLYLLGDLDDFLVERTGEGVDTVVTPFDYQLQENIENLILVGGDPRVGRGNASANELRDETETDPFLQGASSLYGGAGSDTLIGAAYMDGEAGADVMIARAGLSTTFIVDDTSDLVVKSALDGFFASVQSSVTFTLAANTDNLTLTGTEAIDGFGNERSNVLIGNDAANRLVDVHDFPDTELFRDLLYGMDGDDVLEARAGRHLLDGGSGNDSLDAGAGDDLLDGGEGDDAMIGGPGDDVYYVDSVADTTTERVDEGYDTVYSTVSHVLGDNLEALYLLGDADLEGEGNEIDNLIVGNDGANLLVAGKGDDSLDGGDGDDTLVGGEGNDAYVLDSRDDIVLELDGEGVDSVFASDDFELGEHVENLTLLGDFSERGNDIPGLDGAGNDLANVLVGNDGDNDLEGRGGDDEIDGRAGSDRIDGDEGDDILYGGDDALHEEGEDGSDDEEEPFKAPVDRRSTLLALNADVLDGGEGNDSIDGGSGDDSIEGDEGNDWLYGGDDGLTADDVVREDDEEGGGNGGTDEGNGGVFLTNDDELDGGAGDDFLDGGSGEDELLGGEGDDYLYGGGDGPLNIGNDDYLDGGEGRDTLVGGSGDDTYVLFDGAFVETTEVPVYSDCGSLIPDAVTRLWTHDAVIEGVDAGFDTVIVRGDYVLPDHVEALFLDDDADARIGRGNAGDNWIYGNGFANRLEGMAGSDNLYGDAGDDVLDGGAGDDSLDGGSGRDVYLFGRGSGRDVVSGYEGGGDSVHLVTGLTLADITLSTNGTDVTIGIDGTRDRLVLADWFALGSDGVQSILFCDGQVLDAAQIAQLAADRVFHAEDDEIIAGEGAVATGNLLDNDSSSNPAALLSIADPGIYEGEYGILAIEADGSFTYTAGANAERLATGNIAFDLFEYVGQDERNANDVASLSVLVTGRNDAPVIAASEVSTVAEDGPVTIEGEDLLYNGAFEESGFAGWQLDGETGFTGETEEGYDGEAGYFGAVGAPTLLAQEVEASADRSYLVRFRLRGGAPHDATFSASWNGTELLSLADVVLSDYAEFRFFVEGDADDASSLAFALRNDPDFWYLDEVSVQEVETFVPSVQRASGTLEFTDVDHSDTHSLTVQAQADGYLGAFEVALAGDSAFGDQGLIQWSFAVDNDALQHLGAGQTLVQSYDVTVADRFGGAATRTVTVHLAGENDAPTARDDTVQIAADDLEATGNVLANDSDPDQGTVFRVSNAGSHAGLYGTLILEADGKYRYVLDAAVIESLAGGESVTETFDYEVTDDATAAPQSAGATLRITIEGANHAPFTTDDFAIVREDGALHASGNVLANDGDIDHDAVVAVVSTGVFEGAYGSLVLLANGTFEYQLRNDSDVVQALGAGESVLETFTYQVSDGMASTAGTLRIVVEGANDAPSASTDGADVTEDGVVTAHGNVLANDDDPDAGDVLAAIVPGTYAGAFGTLTLAADGAYTYTLDNAAAQVQRLRAGDLVTDVFSYAADDGIAQAQGSIVITIAGANDLPVAVADLAAIQEDAGAPAQGNLLANDADPDAGAALAIANPGTYAGLYGTLTLEGDGSYRYVLDNASPAVQALRQGQVAHDAFAYQLSDGLAQAGGLVTVAVTGVNDAPMLATPIADRGATAGTAFSFTIAAGTFADIDQGDALTWSAALSDGAALPAWLSFDPATRTFAGTAPTVQDLQLRLTATDASGATASDDFVLSVAAAPAGSDSGELIVGTDGNDVLSGTAQDDVIDGRAGFDKMIGGKGNDFYFVDEWCGEIDQVVEKAGEGVDSVFALTDYTAAANVEEVHLLGCEDIDATGNALANVLSGNEGDNVLSGRAGADTYVYAAGGGRDVIDEKGVAGEIDTLKLQGIDPSKARLKRSNDDLVMDFAGRDGSVTFRKWFTSAANRVERFEFGDGMAWDEAKIRSRVGKPVSSSNEGHGQSGACGPEGHSGSHHGGGDDRRHDDDRHRDDRDRHGRDDEDSVDEALGRRLKQPARFDFEEVTRALGGGANGGRTMTAAEIARRWAEIQRYTDCLGDCDDGQGSHGADIAQLRNLFGVSAPQQGQCFGFEGSTGGWPGGDKWLKALEGLCEGFRRL